MAAKASGQANVARERKVAPSTWVLIAVVAATLLLLHTGYTTGEWRGVIVTEVQIAVVGFVTWLAVRASER
ncbi:MAG TPA: hypothetical protein VIS07_16935 [Candidatus Binatia bacterium]